MTRPSPRWDGSTVRMRVLRLPASCSLRVVPHGMGRQRAGLARDVSCLVGPHIVVALPLNYFFLPKPSNIASPAESQPKAHVPLDRAMIVLGVAFAASWMVVAAMAVHLPAGGGGSNERAGRGSRRVDRSIASWRADHGSDFVQAFPSDGFGAHHFADTPSACKLWSGDHHAAAKSCFTEAWRHAASTKAAQSSNAPRTWGNILA